MLTMYDIQNQKYGYKLDNCPIIYSESSHTPLKLLESHLILENHFGCVL